ncbi:hypothetical protein [Burkholderia sp. BCC0405]|uniref:hypothetical protein n=1 Tax=Burkholderia sp. BCC0405 TaxID=2676298 RepID=UPI00158ED476|nr:hypothetical protein [Burkholderia sp. BCC0405]
MTDANDRLQDVVSAQKILGDAYDGNDNQIGAIDPVVLSVLRRVLSMAGPDG